MIKGVSHAHLGSIWYHSGPSDIPYYPNQFFGWDFFLPLLTANPALVVKIRYNFKKCWFRIVFNPLCHFNYFWAPVKSLNSIMKLRVGRYVHKHILLFSFEIIWKIWFSYVKRLQYINLKSFFLIQFLTVFNCKINISFHIHT